ncbi:MULTISPECIES: hypothetical protein [unclassified Streptomyces]|uniref:hypothetical protein n=1 Tax=unclassified Streptomyces TaxID=2593676 RepID=UPI000978E6D8|nr:MULTISPECIES: hypothetical protein [unclassified Streptomyces]ONI49934.1 hypothetical protein STIB_56480 [Streptomyces sp. IB2014 011-1]RDV48510.1 hypothetical protein DDV98_27045 [Streptomyces sp. IB2014 011-12]
MLSPTEPEPACHVDLETDDLTADEAAYRDFQDGLEDDLAPLAQHHADAHSFYVLFDRSATWGHPGMPQFLAVHVKRHEETFTFEQAPLPLAAMAQSWLIHRGCPPDAIGLDPEVGPKPADEITRSLERRLAGDGNAFAMGYSYTCDDPDDMVTVVALRAQNERAPSPFRVVVEETDTDAWTYTLREGGFDTADEALQWCEDRLDAEAGPLPPVRPATAASRPTGVAKAPVPRPQGRTR